MIRVAGSASIGLRSRFDCRAWPDRQPGDAGPFRWPRRTRWLEAAGKTCNKADEVLDQVRTYNSAFGCGPGHLAMIYDILDRDRPENRSLWLAVAGWRRHRPLLTDTPIVL